MEAGQEPPPLDSPVGTALPAQANTDTVHSRAHPHLAASSSCLAKGSDTEMSLQRQQQCERDTT